MGYSNSKLSSAIKKFPLFTLSVFFIICIYGFIVLYSAAGGSFSPWDKRQITVFVAFIPVSFMIALTNIRLIMKMIPAFYVFVLILLIVVAYIGKVSMGAARWLNLGLFNVQPSELAKIAIILYLSRYFHLVTNHSTLKPINFLIPSILVAIPTLFVLKQPDLGTAILIILISITLFFAVGFHIKYFIALATFTSAMIPLIWYHMRDYQRLRVMVFLNPDIDTLGAGYNVIQSKIALGSGGFWGKGFLQGTQSHLRFLPEYQTDFIFALLTEEFGFIGGFILLALYLTLIVGLLLDSISYRNKFAKLLTIGISSLIFYHVVINVSMVMGLLPVVGIPLPLISYGGTMMGSMMICIGILINAKINQHTKI